MSGFNVLDVSIVPGQAGFAINAEAFLYLVQRTADDRPNRPKGFIIPGVVRIVSAIIAQLPRFRRMQKVNHGSSVLAPLSLRKSNND